VLTPRSGTSLAAALIAAMAPPFTLEGKEVFLSASVGVVDDIAGLDAEQAVQRADIAMYAAKVRPSGSPWKRSSAAVWNATSFRWYISPRSGCAAA